jgi:hypothetical protein
MFLNHYITDAKCLTLWSNIKYTNLNYLTFRLSRLNLVVIFSDGGMSNCGANSSTRSSTFRVTSLSPTCPNFETSSRNTFLRNTEPSSWPRSLTSTTSAQNTKCSLETKLKNNIFFPLSVSSFKPFFNVNRNFL